MSPTWLEIALFMGSLALSVVSSIVLAAGIERIGARLRFSEGLQGMATALGADAPELAAAAAALIGGASDMGVGVVLGSNIFNLAGLLGLSAVIAGRVRTHRPSLLLNGVVALAVTAVAVATLMGWLAGWVAIVVSAAVLLPYAVLSSLHQRRVEQLLPEGRVRAFVGEAVGRHHEENRKDKTPRQAEWSDTLSVVPALAAIVLASFGMVRSASALGTRWGVPRVVTGTLILATLTGVPNVLAAIRLAMHGRGSAVLSESLNSNSINAVAGICLPALVVGLGEASGATRLAAWWLLAMTVATLGWAYWSRGIGRWGGVAVIVLYGAFVGTVLVRW